MRTRARAYSPPSMPSTAPRPLPFTFGNHMHWVDMQWLWGYQVLPDSIDDMLALCRAVGAKGNVDFDAVGYEKLAVEHPEALQRLREAVQDGVVEVTGGSFGQPYGLFCGGESNVRQRLFGARTVRRLLGVWPRTFWTEEFDFCPQLPQILKGCGFTGASLFFQWTWHTPEVPLETVPLVQWQGVDGTHLPTVARTQLCLHQWPEDFDGRLDLAEAAARPVLVQWLELMPSRDWMCRSELLLPRLRELFADVRFVVQPMTMGELIAHLDDGTAPVRRYGMDDVFHGMTIGKNGDAVPRLGDEVESRILTAESMAATMGLLGRPYASWDVYPAWELDEAWRELLAAQHHDNHECEGLCGAIGKHSFARAGDLAAEVLQRHGRQLAAAVAVDGDRMVVFNPCGWSRDVEVAAPEDWGDGDDVLCRVARSVPAFGWATVARDDAGSRQRDRRTAVRQHDGSVTLGDGEVSASIGRDGVLRRLAGDGADFAVALGGLRMSVGGAAFAFGKPTVAAVGREAVAHYEGPEHEIDVRFDAESDGVHVVVQVLRLPRPDAGSNASLRLLLGGVAAGCELRHDTPYCVDAIAARGEHVRKYPRGDWMTSEQWFETVRGAFTARSFVDARRPDGSGILCVHDGSQGWFRRGDDLEVVLHAYDAWDEDRWQDPAEDGWVAHLHLLPHGAALAASAAVRSAEAHRGRGSIELGAGDGGAWPAVFGPLVCEPKSVLVTAWHREHRHAFAHVANAFGPEVRNPYVLRLVEYDGVDTEVTLTVAGPCALAAKTDLLGAVECPLQVEPAAAPAWSPPGLAWSRLRLRLRAREIATVMLDLQAGRHRSRDLDDHRHVWATVHRR